MSGGGMVKKRSVTKLGITIEIKPFRKSSGGNNGRKGGTGKKAIITQEGKEAVELRGSSFKDVCVQIRSRFNIPPHLTINEKFSIL